jgi:hypothetical protein
MLLTVKNKLSATDVRDLHDKAYTHGQTTREKAADDLLFFWISQWDDTQLGGSSLQYRGQFDMLRKAARQIISDIKANPVQVDFEPVDGTDDSGADIIDGMYRSDMRNNSALEAKENAVTEAIVCGSGAWELFSSYKTNRNGDNKQVINRRPLFEANNQVFWDPNAKLCDKSDAEYVSCLVGYSENGYKQLVKELGGDEVSDVVSSFAFPEHSYVFPWLTGNTDFYITRFYHRIKRKVKCYIFADSIGSEQQVLEDELDDKEDELIENQFELVEEIEKEVFEVKLYIVGGGDEVLDESIIPGQHIPVVPNYGERAFVEGEEYYEGIVRLAKDPQRLRNFQLSYLADIVSKSPRQKPIFFPEQLQGFEHMYEESGADDNYPYKLQNMKDANGEILPIGAQGVMPEQPMPQALIASIQASREAINDVAAEGLPQNITDMDLSGEALQQIQKMFDKQSFIYQHNLKTALRRDGEIYASMAAVVYDAEQEVLLVKPDGLSSKETINQQEIDPKTLQLVVNNDVKNYIFEVYADIGPSFQSVKEQSRKELKEMINSESPDSPMRPMMLLEYMTMIDGIAFKNMREYARKQLVMQGYAEPETDEEKEIAAQQQERQQNQPDPNMLIAQAEMGKAQAEQMNAQNKEKSVQVDKFNAETNRAKVMVEAEKANADINFKNIQSQGVKIDNVRKVTGADLRQRA